MFLVSVISLSFLPVPLVAVNFLAISFCTVNGALSFKFSVVPFLNLFTGPER